MNCLQFYKNSYINNNNEILFLFRKEENENDFFNSLKKYMKKEKRKREKMRKKRKFKSDDIRKKIKSRFHKTIKNIINENLKKEGSKELFDFLPQSFVSNISKGKNKEVMNLTYKQILETDFTKEIGNLNNHQKIIDLKKFENNLKVLNYLKNNPSISINSGFEFFSKMTYAEILREYFASKEFEESIIKLKLEEENEDYINEYILKAKTYVDFFCCNNSEDLIRKEK